MVSKNLFRFICGYFYKNNTSSFKNNNKNSNNLKVQYIELICTYYCDFYELFNIILYLTYGIC